MKLVFLRSFGLVAATLAWCALASGAAPLPVNYNREVRPILSENCFKCHGPDEAAREAKLRLDVRENAIAPAKSGALPIVPGHPERSELFLRITDRIEPMPPEDSGKKLKPEEIDVLRRWIAGGAPYAPHWSFATPVAATPLPSTDPSQARHPIDRFVLARLAPEKLAPAREADRATLLRRASLDLTGLPPTPAELDAFLADASPDAYGRQVDRLLASPNYGERMAVDWLDAARYADTNGFFRDAGRQAWPWRDWVIDAFNRNLSFDRFIVEQLAGDLLPAPTLEQKVATGFNRNHTTSNESGLIDEEYRVEYVADRLETTATVFLGLTVGCARCHDHKYDPLPQADYYRLFAFFNNTVDKGMVKTEDPPPVMDVTTPAQHAALERLVAARRAKEQEFATATAPLAVPLAAWEKAAAAVELQPPREGLVAHVDFEPEAAADSSAAAEAANRVNEQGNVYRVAGLVGQAGSFDGMQHVELPPDLPIAADRPWTIGVWMKPTGSLNGVFAKSEPNAGRRGFELVWLKGWISVKIVERWVVSAIEVATRDPMKSGDWNHVVVTYDGSGRAAGVRIFTDGVEAPLVVTRDTLQGGTGNHEPLKIGRRDSGLGFYGQLDETRILARAITAQEARAWFWAERLQRVLATDPGQRDAKGNALLVDYFVEKHGDPASRAASRAHANARADEEKFRASLPKTLVMQEVESPRATHILKRGQYDAPGEEVQPGTPAALPPLAAGAPRNRLGLAQWIASPANPLTARVAVNRWWHQCFGEGLVATLGDFGAQGEPPLHPELLDWLAVEFVRTGWDVKALLRLIVTSATYRQSSAFTPELLRRDPDNRLLARGPSFRLSGEMVRDQALAVSGLLVPKLGGPPVKSYQPPGLWEAVSYNGELTYEADRGEGLWRRTVYSYWKRTSPPPGVQLFDGPTREICTVRRPRTNTPLQALLLLNDEGFVEAARALAAAALSAKDAAESSRLEAIFRRATARTPEPVEVASLSRLLARQRAHFAADRESAEKLNTVGRSPIGRGLDPVELAAWTGVAQAVLNLDEFVTRR